jgi:Tol biopolymer transport system component
VAEQLGTGGSNAHFGASPGVLALRNAYNNSRLTWFDRKGSQTGTWGDEATWGSLSLSANGTRLAVSRGGVQRDIWLQDLARGSSTRFTSEIGEEDAPVWSPDGTQIVYGAYRTGSGVSTGYLMRKGSQGGGEPQPLLSVPGRQLYPQDWSRDGRYVLYVSSLASSQGRLFALPLEGEHTPVQVFADPTAPGQDARFSPDGRWIVYASNESGRSEIYVQAFTKGDGRDGKWTISTAGGTQPRWRRDGKEVVYLAPDGRLMSVEVTIKENGIEAGVPNPLFPSGISRLAVMSPRWDMSADGQKFIVNATGPQTAADQITVVLNWQAQLK